jgi:putative heme-binding domain-containing protein
LPVDSPTSRYKFAELLEFLETGQGTNGDPERGAQLFEKAQCIKCHRFGPRGEAMGPDLTNTRQWLQLKQMLEATVFPSQSITDQYETTTIVTTEGQVFSGVVAAADGKIVVLQADGKKISLERAEIEESVPSRNSAMPDGLLDPLSLDEIADLFAYLRSRRP